MPLLFLPRLWIEIARTMLPEGRAVGNARAAVERDRRAALERAAAEAALSRAARRLAERRAG
jgi:hypothetical protein